MILFLVTILINALWQPVLITGVTWLVLRLSRCSNATTRHAIWMLALCASVAVPVVSALPTLWAPPAQTTQTATTATQPVQSTAHAQQNASLPPVLHKTSTSAQINTAAPSEFRPAFPAIPRPAFSVHPTVALVIAAAWLVVMLAILARLFVSFFYLERLKHDALPLSIEARHELVRWERAEKGDRDVRICVSDEITVPVAVGIFDAMILLPSDLVHELEPKDLDRVLLHELAHVRRSDDWVNLFERVVQAVFFFSPAIYWICRQTDLEREVACDDWVLEQSADNVPYARCLAKIVEMTQWPHHAVAAPGVFVTRKSMSIRIERLLARGRDIRVRLALVPSLVAFLAIAAIVVSGGFVSPTIAYTIQSAALPQHATFAHRSEIPTKAHLHAIARSTGRAAEHGARHEGSHALDSIAILASATPTIVAQTTPSAHASSKPRATPRPVSVKTASPPGGTYLDELSAAGYSNLSATEVIELKSLGVDGNYIREMRSLGLKDLTPSGLAELKSLGVDAAYVRDLEGAGYSGLSSRQLVELKSLNVNGEYIRNISTQGLKNLSPRELMEVKSLNVDSGFMHELQGAGYSGLTIHQLTAFKSLGITGGYIRSLQTQGFKTLTPPELTAFKSLGVDSNYVHELQAAGLNGLSVHDLTALKSLGVDSAYIADLASAGYPHLEAHQYLQLKALGIDSSYIANLKRHNFTNLTVDQLVRYKSLGINP